MQIEGVEIRGQCDNDFVESLLSEEAVRFVAKLVRRFDADLTEVYIHAYSEIKRLKRISLFVVYKLNLYPFYIHNIHL